MIAMPPLYSVTQDARRLVEDGQDVEAAARLAAALQLHDAVASPTDPDLIDAAMTFAAIAGRAPVDQLSWARYAYQASLRAYGPDHDVTTDTAEVLISVLRAQDLSVDAIIVLDALSDAYIRRNDIADASRTRSLLAEQLHDDGRCDEAERQITTAKAYWRPQRSDPDMNRSGAMIAITGAVILAGCGRHDAALSLLRSQQQLLSTLDPVTRAAAGLSGYMAIVFAEAQHSLVCTRPLAAGKPTRAPLRTYQKLLCPTRLARVLSASSNPRPAHESPELLE